MNVTILDRAPELDALREQVQDALEVLPQLRRRPVGSVLQPTTVTWVDCPDMDLDFHVRRVGVPNPGSMRELLDLAATVAASPFDAARPLWELVVAEGLEDGRCALLQKVHHVMSDGIGGVRMLSVLTDPRIARAKAPARVVEADATESAPGDPLPAWVDWLIPRIWGFQQPGARLFDAVKTLRDPVKVATGVHSTLEMAGSLSRQVLGGGPLSPLMTEHSLASRFEVLCVDDARASALALGGSRTDLLVAGVAGALGLYHERMGSPCAELRLSMPVSVRSGTGAGGNWFVPTRLEVPTQPKDPGPRFWVTRDRLARARTEATIRRAEALAAAINRLPTPLLVAAVRAQARTVDFSATAIPGLRPRRSVAGATIEASYPIGPRLGCPLNVTAFGIERRLDVGLNIDTAAIEDPETLIDCLNESFTALKPPPGR
jgi:WS/DGAT/MGAT family acyltransferase